VSDLETRFHEEWLGMVQPVEGLVVSLPVLVERQCMRRLGPDVQQRLLDLCQDVETLVESAAPAHTDGTVRERRAGAPASEPRSRRRAAPAIVERGIADLDLFLADVLQLTPDLFDRGMAIPPGVSVDVAEGPQTIRPTLALRRQDAAPEGASPYVLFVWDLGAVPGGVGLDLDKPETATGPWHYPPAAKFERLLREVRVPIGLLTNRRALRLVYAPAGESTGAITFRIDDMASVGGRPILDAFVMLLSATRLFGVAPEQQLPALLVESRLRQADVTNELAAQVFQALELLLAGFEAAAERDGDALLRDALERERDHLYGGLLTVLLRLVFLLYAEDRGLLPVDDPFYEEHVSVLGLFDRLQKDHGQFPDSMARRHGAWGQLVTIFRIVYLGVQHGDLRLPPRRGELFDPHRYPFLEGWGPEGSAPIDRPEEQAAVRVPTVDDLAVFRVLEKLIVFQGQRLSYRALDVEQIGSVYEALMGHHVERMTAAAVCLRPNRVWVTASEVLDVGPGTRTKWLQETVGLSKAQAERLAQAIKAAADEGAVLDALAAHQVKGTDRAAAGRLVIQPGAERRRTSSHYTPRSLSAPIVRRTLEPLLATMKPHPQSRLILELKVCDPAMGSGAFLVEACRFLADALVAAWTREGQLESIRAKYGDEVHHARRLIAQSCLYGVDKNPFAVSLAKLSLWLTTLAKDLPFTFVDHALRHGDSLVGLSLDQVRAFDWKPGAQLELFAQAIDQALNEALDLRKWIIALAHDPRPECQREKEYHLKQADDAIGRARLIADVCVGAFFAHDKDKARRAERERRLTLVAEWLGKDMPPTPELERLRLELRERVPAFHWMLEFPEIFYTERPDPLDGGTVNRGAWMDALIGNPPFAGGHNVSGMLGLAYSDWLAAAYNATKSADYCAFFFRRAASLLGKHGTIGLIATKTIAEGDTRASGLQPLLRDAFVIYEAIPVMSWPGDAAVSVAVVHLARGNPAQDIVCRIEERPVPFIDSRLLPRRERSDPVVLTQNANLAFQGTLILGMGFTLTQAKRDALVKRRASNAQRIRPYLGRNLPTIPRHAADEFTEALPPSRAPPGRRGARRGRSSTTPTRRSSTTPTRRSSTTPRYPTGLTCRSSTRRCCSAG
jgi:hypothetical protein